MADRQATRESMSHLMAGRFTTLKSMSHLMADRRATPKSMSHHLENRDFDAVSWVFRRKSAREPLSRYRKERKKQIDQLLRQI